MVDFRKAFAEKLNEFVIPSTTPQEDKSSMIKELDDLVLHNLPSSLYKYRSCNIRNIEALSRNVTYGVPVSYMNDPMDGLVYIDKNKIIADAKFGLSRGFVEFVKSTKCLPSSMDIYLDDDKRESILNAILNSSEEDIATIITQNQQSEEELIAFIDTFIIDYIANSRISFYYLQSIIYLVVSSLATLNMLDLHLYVEKSPIPPYCYLLL